MKLKGQVAFITAAAGAGVGLATAKAFAAEGAEVIVTDIHEKRTMEAARALEQEFGRSFTGLVLDVTNEAQVDEVIKKILAKHGRIDIIVNNAARNIPKPIWEMSTETWNQIMDACLTSQFWILRAALPSMIERKAGCVINVSSGAGWVPFDSGDSAYSAAKAGVMALTRAVAAEVGRHGVRVNCVAPDLIWNEHLARIYPPEYFEKLRAKSVTGKAGTPEDMAHIIMFLATDKYLTGQVINGSGGFYMHP
ncbi:MAG: SDR family NAD(P)-dependent oxidoreductase [Kofleriaceae bacterium]